MTLQYCDESDVDIKMLPYFVQKDPLMTAIHFDRRWRALFKVCNQINPFGKVLDYFTRLEFQSIGSPHLHIFLWIENALTLTTTTSGNDTVSYIDNIISTQIPNKTCEPELHDLVLKLQTHKHTHYCQRQKTCRFHFLFKECNQTRLLTAVELGLR